MTYLIYEVEYSCSPSGVDKWEIAKSNGDFIAGDFDTARSAFDYLVDNTPADQLLHLEVRSLEWWHKIQDEVA